MCVSQCRWMNCRGQCTPALPLILLLLPLSFLSFTFPFAQGERHIPKTCESICVCSVLQPPVLTQMPTSHTIFVQEDSSLYCEATGNPTPTFRWVKDGELFGSEHVGSGTLKAGEVGNSLELYEGHFCCYASNTLGTAMTQTVKVTVEPRPVLLKQRLIRKTAFQGESIILSCNPPGSSTPPSIHWMNMKLMHITRSERVMIGLDGNLYFANLEMRDSREDYICHALYKEARTILPATSVSLTVKQRDVFHGGEPDFFHPANSSVMVLRGHKFTLECIPKGLPTPKVEWQKKDGILENTTGQVTNIDRWLHFDSITQDDDGEYECNASNIHGFATRSFTVTVEAAPYWVKKPQSLMYAPGETVKLDCQAEGTPKPTITWRINSVLITEVDEEPRRTVTSGSMILRDVNIGDTAVYQCEATNVHGSILLNAYVYVIELPPQSLSSDRVIYEAVEGGDIALHCESFGSPQPHIIWEREDMVPLLSNPRVSLEINGTLKLSGVSGEDSGVYTCSTGNTDTFITAELHVFNRTVILEGPQDLRALRGTTVLLDCRFYVDPRLRSHRVAWKQGSHKLSQDDKYTIFENSTLKVVDIQLNDSSEYTCEVITDLDYANAQGSIAVIVPPDPPNYLSLSNIEGPNLTLNWIPGRSNNSPITEFIIVAQRESHVEETKWKWEELKRVPGNFNHVELTLRLHSTYQFSVIAINEAGQSSPSIPSDHHSMSPAGRLSITSWLIRIICSIIIITILVLIPIILQWRQGSKYREHPLTGTPGSACEDSTYQSLDPASRDLEQTYSALTHHA
ncbi:neural cell adhesion molecule L1-like [Archocentrus centrarchus]|uniref:neural cell adhesion molecule L1-like n=1 Tax=Archocentrus centrarchus TaxID=63155 RepID=UPI0011E9E96E|nr:neural cell adhesion molecule L1-like [Archocentrus centrarchus]